MISSRSSARRRRILSVGERDGGEVGTAGCEWSRASRLEAKVGWSRPTADTTGQPCTLAESRRLYVFRGICAKQDPVWDGALRIEGAVCVPEPDADALSGVRVTLQRDGRGSERRRREAVLRPSHDLCDSGSDGVYLRLVPAQTTAETAQRRDGNWRAHGKKTVTRSARTGALCGYGVAPSRFFGSPRICPPRARRLALADDAP